MKPQTIWYRGDDWAVLKAECEEWRKQVGSGVQSQWDEGKKYEARIAELEGQLAAATQRRPPKRAGEK